MSGVLPVEVILARGVVFLARLDQAHLQDPQITTHDKLLVVLNTNCPSDPTYMVMATSNVERFDRLPHLKAETVPLDHARYAFLDRPTVLDFTDVQSFALAELRTMVRRGLLTVIGRLEADDLAACDAVIRASMHIEPRVLPQII